MRYCFSKIILSIAFVLFAMLVKGQQIETYQLSLRDSTLNELYVGWPNKIRFVNLPPGAVVTASCPITRVTQVPNTWNAMPSHTGVDTIYVRSRNQLVFSKQFVNRYIGDPIARVGNIRRAYASVSEILAQPFIRITIDSCNLKTVTTVLGFDYLVACKYQDPVTGFTKGNLFPEKLSRLIATMKRDDKLVFSNIHVTCPDCRTVILNEIQLTIH